MENLKVDMKPVVSDSGLTFKLKIEATAGAVECEEIIRYIQSKSTKEE